jgi:DNA polymerase-3 subunit delta
MMSPTGKANVLLIHGSQRLLVEDELKKIRAKISEKVDVDFNLDIFDAGDDSLESALQAADTLPMASDRRYVIVRDAQKLTAAEVKRLGRYIENPAESSALILVAVALKSNAPLLRALEKGGRIKEVSKRRDQIPGWIRSRFKERGLKVSGKALAYLSDALGEDLLAIEGAVEKISLYHEGEGEVELDEVVLLVAASAERSIYELVDRVALGDADQSVKLLHRLLHQGERPIYILSALTRRFRSLLIYRALKEDGHQESEIVDYLRLPRNQTWMVSKRFKPQAAKLNEERLRKALSLLVRAETGIKTGEIEEDFAVELAVTGLTTLVK